MTSVAPDGNEAAAAKLTALTQHDISRLRNASGWARFLAVVGFVVTGLIGLAVVVVSRRSGGNGSFTMFSLPYLLSLVSVGGSAWLLWGFGRNVSSFLRSGEPRLTRAFADLRQFFKLWTFVVALSTLLTVLSVFEP